MARAANRDARQAEAEHALLPLDILGPCSPMFVLGIAGSCRLGGNTETLLDDCLEAARQEGAEVQKLRLSELDLHPCRGCEVCSKKGTCIVNDGMQQLYPLLQNADSLVLAAPVYSMGMPALPKMMIDRCQPFWAWKYVLGRKLTERDGRPERRGAFLSCAGTQYAHVFDGSKQVMRYLWHILEVRSYGEVLCSGVDEKGAITAHPSARAEAAEIGRRLGERRPPQGPGAA